MLWIHRGGAQGGSLGALAFENIAHKELERGLWSLESSEKAS